jgi:ABC-type polysaccharide/polyol phosphate export permease
MDTTGSRSLQGALAADPPSARQLALTDLRQGIAAIHIWPMLGWQEVRQRYRRSVLGPFWLTISTGVLVGAMGPLYGRLFDLDIRTYFPYLGVSYVLWAWIATAINEACNGFIGAESYIKQVKLPLSVHMLRVAWKNLVVFFHNLLVIALVMLYARPALDATVLLVPFGVVALAVNTFVYGMMLGMVCARFRDVPLIIANLVQVAFFLTPVLWKPGMLGRHAWAVEINPFFHFMEVIRAPLLGEPTPVSSWIAVALITAVGVALMVAVFARFRARIAYWV